MSSDQQFQLNQPAVISETIDGEAIIVNLDSGAYYSLRDTGGVIWDLLVQGATVAQVVEQMTGQYDAPAQAIEADVQDLVVELQAEQLIVALDGQAAPVVPAVASNGDRLPFQKPILEKFTDMADLLLLDPIHEVDELGGWPHAASSNQ